QGAGTFIYNLRFPGQYYDDESGLHYNYHRDYDPHSGRYLESDAGGLQDGTNTYTYVRSRPTIAVDPAGLYSVSINTTVEVVDVMPRDPYWNKGGDTWPTVLSKCACEQTCGGWKLTECSTMVDTAVSIKGGLPPEK